MKKIIPYIFLVATFSTEAATIVIDGGDPGVERAAWAQSGYYVDSAATIVPLSTSTSFNEFIWWGSYGGGGMMPTDDFRFSIFEQGAAQPIFSFDLLGIERQYVSELQSFQYDALFPLVSLAPGIYEFDLSHLGKSWMGTDPSNWVMDPLGLDWVWYFSKNGGAQSGIVVTYFDGTRSTISNFSSENNSLAFKALLTDVISPVPEPETYALMLVGLVVVGAAARRRQAVNAGSKSAAV
jgi:hypothetical protein